MKMARLFGIVYLLLEKQHVTAKELAERFEVSKRTILRDIDTLTIAGIPLYTSKGKGGGIFLLEDFTLNKTTITEEEQSQILLALQSLTATEHIDVSGVLSKLGALFGKSGHSWIEVDFSRWGYNTQDKNKFEMLKLAILNQVAISFTYMSSNGNTKNRTVYPLKMVFKSKAWYMQAFCLEKQAYRLFKIARMINVAILEESFSNKAFPAPFMESERASSVALVELTLLFSKSVAYRVYDEFDPKDVVKNKDGSFTVSVSFPEDEWLYGFLLSFGSAVQVVAPKKVKDTLLVQVEAIKNLYLEI